jgi:hypothetical protein
MMETSNLAKYDPLSAIYTVAERLSNTYDHRILRTRLPVRSALFKQNTGGLVVKWVTIGESLLLYVFCSFWLREKTDDLSRIAWDKVEV